MVWLPLVQGEPAPLEEADTVTDAEVDGAGEADAADRALTELALPPVAQPATAGESPAAGGEAEHPEVAVEDDPPAGSGAAPEPAA
jgi:hypothetical protein